MIDIGNEIISSLQLQRPKGYQDIPYILARSYTIPEGFTNAMISTIGFRNLLVHDYASINLELVYEFLQTRLENFQEFIRYMIKWLQKMSPTPYQLKVRVSSFSFQAIKIESSTGSSTNL